MAEDARGNPDIEGARPVAYIKDGAGPIPIYDVRGAGSVVSTPAPILEINHYELRANAMLQAHLLPNTPINYDARNEAAFAESRSPCSHAGNLLMYMICHCFVEFVGEITICCVVPWFAVLVVAHLATFVWGCVWTRSEVRRRQVIVAAVLFAFGLLSQILDGAVSILILILYEDNWQSDAGIAGAIVTGAALILGFPLGILHISQARTDQTHLLADTPINYGARNEAAFAVPQNSRIDACCFLVFMILHCVFELCSEITICCAVPWFAVLVVAHLAAFVWACVWTWSGVRRRQLIVTAVIFTFGLLSQILVGALSFMFLVLDIDDRQWNVGFAGTVVAVLGLGFLIPLGLLHIHCAKRLSAVAL